MRTVSKLSRKEKYRMSVFPLAVGIGGDYPLSAIIMSEYANK